MVTDTLCPDESVTGNFSPWISNSELVDWSDEMVTDPFEALSVACRVALEPTLTEPKFRVPGVTDSSEVVEWEPYPLTFKFSETLRAVLVRVKRPVVSPEAVGEKIMGNCVFAPGWRVTGKVNLPNEKALPRTDLAVILSVFVPVFES